MRDFRATAERKLEPHHVRTDFTHRGRSIPRDARANSTLAARCGHRRGNHSYNQIVRSTADPYLHRLMSTGASFSNFHGLTHPSQGNYIALFSGSRHGVTGDECPRTIASANIASQLLSVGDTFVGYAEGMPTPGFSGCAAGNYVRRHCPWIDFRNVPSSDSRPLAGLPTNLSDLPNLMYVIPDLAHDMHNGTIAQADTWLKHNLARYASWAPKHDSLLVVTWDEDHGTTANHIPTLAVGSGVPPTVSAQHLTAYSLLGSLETSFGLAHLGNAASAPEITALGLS